MKLKNSGQELFWAEAKRRCHLSDEALRMAREMGLNPCSPAPVKPRETR